MDALRLDTLVRPYKSLFVLLYYNGRSDRASLQNSVTASLIKLVRQWTPSG